MAKPGDYGNGVETQERLSSRNRILPPCQHWPKTVCRQVFWGLDLCFCTDGNGQTHAVLGLCEHQSRRALVLQRLPNKASVTLLAWVKAAVQQFGPPQVLLTDNEAVFTSAVFRQGLRALGIRHRCIPKGKPWRNGRIERLFGTLKRKLRQTRIADGDTLDAWLAAFRFWYRKLPRQVDISKVELLAA